MGRFVPVQDARHQEDGHGVWSTRERLQPDPAVHPAQSGEGGGGMDRQSTRGVGKGQRSESPNEVKRLKTDILSY